MLDRFLAEKSRVWLYSLVVAPVLLMGCSDDGRPKVYPVRGQVLFGGRPTKGALVVFHRADNLAVGVLLPQGRVEADGSFRLTTFTAYDGAPAGEYAVTITWPGRDRTTPDPVDDGAGPDRFYGRFSDPKKPFCRIAIEPKENVLEPFRLK